MRPILFIITVFLMLTGCTKSNKDSTEQTNSKLSITYTFDKSESLNDWQVTTPHGSISIDTVNFVVGTGSMTIIDSIGCIGLERKNAVTVKPNTNYKFSMKTKYVPKFICASAYTMAIRIIQGTEYSFGSIGGESWQDDEYYFHSDSTGLPIKIGIILSKEQAWIDELKIEEQ